MDKTQSLVAFAALSQETRLDVFRLLIVAGPDGLLAGDIGEKLNVRQNTMSANLAVLSRAGLIRGQREGRNIRYCADFDGIRGLMRFLMEDCCANSLCGSSGSEGEAA
ncbi:MAG: metalloregulator ArsR/SmtB family transcription factor [Xanthobacteraceae bacterium]|nr:metalloregulator ArsR/SmtB family transcription factor [Xanthobacteraceae bacterium]